MNNESTIIQSGDWLEDFALENGNYECSCFSCGRNFIGYKRRVVCKLCHEKYLAAFVSFTPDFDYEKEFYDVLLPSGEIIKHCWPNAGVMNEVYHGVENSGRNFSAQDGVKIQLSPDSPLYEKSDPDKPQLIMVAAGGGHPMGKDLVGHLALAQKDPKPLIIIDTDDRPIGQTASPQKREKKKWIRSELGILSMMAASLPTYATDAFMPQSRPPSQLPKDDQSAALKSANEKISLAGPGVVEEIRKNYEAKLARRAAQRNKGLKK